jgi:hypothetical protein
MSMRDDGAAGVCARRAMMTVYCVKCGRPQAVSCTDEQYRDWRENHQLIQRAMPNVPAEERELLLSGYCSACFQALFPDEEE